MKIVDIPVAMIQDNGRARPVTPAVAEQLAQDIEARGLRTPIEVAILKNASGYRLVSGGHRLAAFRILERETIPAVVVQGNALELRRDELLENLARNELSMLERAQFLAELKRVYQELHPEAKHGGNRKGDAQDQVAKLADWFRDVAQRGDWSVRTVERATLIGEKLAPAAANMLRGTRFEDNQQDLDALARVEPERQLSVVSMVVRPVDPLPTIRRAIEYVQGRTERPAVDHLAKIRAAWNRASRKEQIAFVRQLVEDGFDDGDTVLCWIDATEGDDA